MFGLAPKMPAAPTIPETPPVQPVVDAPAAMGAGGAADAAGDKERQDLLNRRGRASTILTGGMGDTSAVSIKAPVATGAKTLLGN
ncbi:MAG: hypothetical protein IT555_05975 [Acetobacteraceae bacterium]|nr:hypothetical protein [Acetobacteraceae bacterium]